MLIAKHWFPGSTENDVSLIFFSKIHETCTHIDKVLTYAEYAFFTDKISKHFTSLCWFQYWKKKMKIAAFDEYWCAHNHKINKSIMQSILLIQSKHRWYNFGQFYRLSVYFYFFAHLFIRSMKTFHKKYITLCRDLAYSACDGFLVNIVYALPQHLKVLSDLNQVYDFIFKFIFSNPNILFTLPLIHLWVYFFSTKKTCLK